MYDLAYRMLTAAGYHAHYGSVNFSKRPGETGTSAYFEGRLLSGMPYIGIGNYSTSWVDPFWFFRERAVTRYIQKVKEGTSTVGDFYRLPDAELMAKYILYSFNYGFVDNRIFSRRFGGDLEDKFPEEIDFIRRNRWMELQGTRWQLQPGEFRNIHLIRSLFYSPQAKDWMRALENPI